MLFKRREEAGWLERFRVWLWPRVSWRRSWSYYAKRVLRLQATPHAIAAGCAAGAAVSFTPLVGFHFILAFLVAFVLRGNLIAAALGTAVGNPFTFPIMWAGSYQLGTWILRGEAMVMSPRLVHDLMEKSFEQLWPVLQPTLVGAVPLGIVGGAIVYAIAYKMVTVYQHARRERLAQVQAVKERLKSAAAVKERLKSAAAVKERLKGAAAVTERLKGAGEAAKAKVKSLKGAETR
jgi:uncharacterized protein